MPLLSHKEHGFQYAAGLEAEAMLQTGWVVCTDIVKAKAEMGIASSIEKPVEPAILESHEPVKRRGRPRVAVPSFLMGADNGDSTDTD